MAYWPTREAFLARLDGLVKAIRANPVFGGFCDTQPTNVEQKINGLLTYDRRPKADLAEIAKIMGRTDRDDAARGVATVTRHSPNI